MIALVVLAGCHSRDELRWTNSKAVPDGAAQRLAEQLPPLFQPLGAGMAADYLHYMLEREWDGVTDGWGKRHSMKSSYDNLAGLLQAAPVAERLFVLADEAYAEGRLWLEIQADALAYRRVALAHPSIVAAPRDDVGIAAHRFQAAPRIGDHELIKRADALTEQLSLLRRRFRAFVPWDAACKQHLDDKERELLTKLSNARGDLRVTTGPLHQLLREHGIPTRGATDFDEGIIGERTCRKPHRSRLPDRRRSESATRPVAWPLGTAQSALDGAFLRGRERADVRVRLVEARRRRRRQT